MHCKSYPTRSYNVKDNVKYMAWTNEMDRCLSKILVEQVKNGNKIDGILKPAAYEAAVKALNGKFRLDLTKEHIRNRLKTWKKQYGALKELLAQKGFKWDDAQKMVIADDSVWNDYIKTQPDARFFRARVFENYDQLCNIFDNCNEAAGAVYVSPVQCSDKAKDQGKNIRWTHEMDCYLSKILVEQVKLGNKNKLYNELKPAAYLEAVFALNERFQFNLTQEHVRNRLRSWKKQYDILKDLLDQSDFEWDEKRKMVIATDSVWHKYIKINPDVRLLRGRIIENYDELCVIIGCDDPHESSLNDGEANFGLTADNEALETEDLFYNGTDGVKEKGKYTLWTDKMDSCLTEQLVEQAKLGNKIGKNFKSVAYMAALTVLNEKFGLNLTKENIRNRLKTWKKQYVLVQELLSCSGFEWDRREKMVVARDSEWNKYIKRNPDARHLRGRSIENYDDLHIIIGNEQAGDRAKVGLNPTTISEEHVETSLQVLGNEETSNGMEGSSQQARARPSSSSQSEQPFKRRRGNDMMLEMMSAMAANISRIADALESNKTVRLDELFEMVQTMAGFDDDLIIEACEYLSFDEKRARLFMKLDERLRKKWLLKRLGCQGS